jgi:uncharacterized membrane protein YbhN (UPF0104 family)
MEPTTETTTTTPDPTTRAANGRFPWARVGVAVALLVVIAVLGRRFYGELDRLAGVPARSVALIALLYLVARAFNAGVIYAGLARLGHGAVRSVEVFFLLMTQYTVNMLVPRSGIGVPAGYLKLKRGVPVADFTAVQLLPGTLVMFVCVGIAGLAALVMSGDRFDAKLAALFGIVTVGATALVATGTPAHRAGTRLVSRFVTKMSDANRRLGLDWPLLAGATGSHVIALLLRGLRLQLAFSAVGAPVSFASALVASCASDVLFLVSLTPGALGFREGAIVYAARVLGTTGDVALSAAVLDRIVISAVNVLFACVGMGKFAGRSKPTPVGNREAVVNVTPITPDKRDT